MSLIVGLVQVDLTLLVTDKNKYHGIKLQVSFLDLSRLSRILLSLKPVYGSCDLEVCDNSHMDVFAVFKHKGLINFM